MKYILAIAALTFTISALPAFAEIKTVTGAKEDLKDFKKEVDKSLTKIDGDIHTLAEQAKAKNDSVKKTAAEDAKKARAKIEEQVDNLKNKSKATWSKTKNEISASVDSLSQKIKDALKD